MMRTLASKTPLEAPRYIRASLHNPHLAGSCFPPLTLSRESSSHRPSRPLRPAQNSSEVRIWFATHSETKITLTHRKHTIGPDSVRDTFRDLGSSISARLSTDSSPISVRFVAGLSAISSDRQRDRFIARSNKARGLAHACFPFATFAIPSGTKTLLSCRISNLGRGI